MTHHLPTLALACLFLSGAQAQVTEGQQAPAGVHRYGADTRWVYGYLPSPASCSNATFKADPAPGVVKRCEPVPINAASCVLPVMGGAGLNPDFGFGASGGWLSWWCPSTKGPQLRIVAGPTLASLSAMKCFVTSTESPSKSLAKCAPAKVTDPGPRAVWEPVIGQILGTVPK